MKKITALVLTLILCVSVMASALAATEKEILFRGAEWGATAEKTLNSLKKKNLSALTITLGNTPGGTVMYLACESMGLYFDEYGCRDELIGSYANFDPLDVAGYTCKDTCIYFAYLEDKNGNLKTDWETKEKPANTAFYGAEYQIEAKDPEAVLADLKNKLTSLYGEPDVTDTYEAKLTGEVPYYQWYGANDTTLILNAKWHTAVSIFYGWLGGDALYKREVEITTGQKILEEEQEKEAIGNGNVNGL